MADQSIQLQGKIFIKGEIKTLTGLHIGGRGGDLEIGGNDNPVIRNPLTNEPYIPGSSLRGKMRSLLDRNFGNPLNKKIGRNVRIYESKTAEDFAKSPVCNVFGVTPDNKPWIIPTRLIVRDVLMTDKTRENLDKADTDLSFTEIKTEVAIDRITSAANPRPLERVPAGAVFGPFEMIYSLYTLNSDDQSAGIDRDLRFFGAVLTAMKLLEDDYLGGSGSRGSGKIAFQELTMEFKSRNHYEDPKASPIVEIAKSANVDQLRDIDYRAEISSAIG